MKRQADRRLATAPLDGCRGARVGELHCTHAVHWFEVWRFRGPGIELA
jgi:hypothetical protein